MRRRDTREAGGLVAHEGRFDALVEQGEARLDEAITYREAAIARELRDALQDPEREIL